MSWADAMVTAARLKVLELLVQVPGYELNDQLIARSLESMGLRFAQSQVRAELSWLESVRTITLLTLPGNIIVASLTERGHDVAKGLLQVPGIDRPVPGSGL